MSWFTHGMLEAGNIRSDAVAIARGMNSWWNNCTYIPQLFPMDGSDEHVGPDPTGYDPANNMTSSEPFANGHMLYWMNQAGIGHSRMAMSSQGTQADVDFLVNLFTEQWWLDLLAAEDPAAIWARKWYPDNYEITTLEAYMDLYMLTGTAKYLAAVQGGMYLFKSGWMFPGGSVALNENYAYRPGSLPLEFDGRWGVHTRPTGELCPSSFWIYLNQRMHRLFPGNATFLDEIETALYNVALAGQGPNGTGVRYFARLHGEKDVVTNEGTCCESQSARLFGAVPEFIFSSLPGRVSIDLFEAATLLATSMAGVAVSVTIDSLFPAAPSVSVIVSPAAPLQSGDFSLSLRIPTWAQGPVTVLINGTPLSSGPAPAGTYVQLPAQAWAAGPSLVSLSLPLPLAAFAYAGETQKASATRSAYMAGPFLLAAVGPWDASLDCILINSTARGGVDPMKPEDWLVPVAGTEAGALAVSYTVKGQEAVSFIPYYGIENGVQFTVYPCFV